jgi:hypothetical protein
VPWLSHVKSKGNEYVYLAVYNNQNNISDRKERHVFSFGRLDKALALLQEWKEDPSYIPSDIKELGCTGSTIDRWLSKLSKRKMQNC